MLKLGNVLSKGDESPDAPFFLEEDNGENAETFEVKAEQIVNGENVCHRQQWEREESTPSQ